ncbi:MAG: hypothetical protein IKE46_00800 [Selenomonadaceae bacterium]|nr:hypothetical protein [Selenomonadaceae bacterium]
MLLSDYSIGSLSLSINRCKGTDKKISPARMRGFFYFVGESLFLRKSRAAQLPRRFADIFFCVNQSLIFNEGIFFRASKLAKKFFVD